MEEKLKIPLGIDDFKVVSKQCYYVDKTLMIKDVLSMPEESVVLFTRPRRFGKSLAISMLSTFFDEKNPSSKQYFEGKRIAMEKEFALCGSYPVIALGFKDIRSKTFEDLQNDVMRAIRDEFLRHDELLLSDKTSAEDKAYLGQIKDGWLEEESYPESLLRLCRMLHAHHGKKPYLFIDEYDTPIQAGYENGYYDEAITFFRALYGKALKGNQFLQTAVLTGVLRIAKESLFSGINNLVVDNGFDSAFNEYFGFSYDEAKELVAYFGADHSLEELWKWYGGYWFGGVEVINPWSILSYFRFKRNLKEYWTNTSSVSILSSLLSDPRFSYSGLIGDLLAGKRVKAKPNLTVSYADLSGNVGQFLGFLIAAGYLSYLPETGESFVPNLEASIALQDEILSRYGLDESQMALSEFKQAIKAGDGEAFASLLRRVILHSFSYFDFNQERSYQAMVLTLVSILFEDCFVKSEVLTGEGRCDILVQPKSAHGFGAVLEIKHVKGKTSQQRLEERAESALRQIGEKGYVEDLFLAKAKPIVAYGIAFCQKRVVIKSQLIKEA